MLPDTGLRISGAQGKEQDPAESSSEKPGRGKNAWVLNLPIVWGVGYEKIQTMTGMLKY